MCLANKKILIFPAMFTRSSQKYDIMNIVEKNTNLTIQNHGGKNENTCCRRRAGNMRFAQGLF